MVSLGLLKVLNLVKRACESCRELEIYYDRFKAIILTLLELEGREPQVFRDSVMLRVTLMTLMHFLEEVRRIALEYGCIHEAQLLNKAIQLILASA